MTADPPTDARPGTPGPATTGGNPWPARSVSTSARRTPSSPSSKVESPPSSPTPKAPGPPRPWSRSPSPARSSSVRSPSGRPSPTSTAPSGRSSATWAPTGRPADRRQDVHPPADQRVRAAEAQARRRGLPRRAGHRRGDHRAGVLLRRAAPGHQGGGRDRRPQREPHRQRADRGRAGLRPRQGRRPDHPRLRPRWRHVRRVPPRDRRGRGRGQGHLRRQPPRWRRLGQQGRRVDGHEVQGQQRRGPRCRQDRQAAPPGGRREGEDRAVELQRDHDPPALHHPRRVRPAPLRGEADPRGVPEDDRRPARAHARAVQVRAQGRRRATSARSTTS